MSEKKYRSFKIKEADGTFRGRYLGESPYQAANKALSEIIRKDKDVNTNDINFTLIESTKGSKNKEHKYQGKRIKLNEPITYQTKNGINVEKKYKNELKKIKKSDS